MKRFGFAPMLVLTACLLVGCTGRPEDPAASSAVSSEEETLAVDALCVELPRSAAENMDAVHNFSELLRTALADHGVDAQTVNVTFGTSEAATAQALENGGVQAAFLTGESYVEFGSGALAVAAGNICAEREDGDSTDPADWNGESGFAAARTVSRAGERALLVSGPSDYGAQLARRVLGGKTPSWSELDHAAWGVVAGEMAMASQWLEDSYEGNALSDLADVTVFDTYEDLLQALSDGQVDGAVLTEDMLFYCADLGMWTAPAFEYVENGAARGLGRENPMWDEVTVLGVSERYFTTAAVVSRTDETASADALIAAFQAAVIDLGQSHGEELAAVGVPAMESVSDSQFDGMRRAFSGEN